MQHLQDLSMELLLKIFEYCGIWELFQLRKTCTQFYQIINNTTGLGNSIPLLVTNQLRQEMRSRSFKLLTIREKCFISHCWKNGMYEERCLLKSKKKYIPWLILTRNHVWLSKGSQIHAYRRSNYYLDVQKPCYSIGSPNTADICKFVYKQNCLISGQRDGSVHIWKSENDSVCLQDCHQGDVNSVDLEGNIFVTASKDQSVKIWALNTEPEQLSEPRYCYDMNDRVWSTALDNRGQYLAVGTAGHNSIPPLHIFDLNRHTKLQELGINFRKGSGILQMKWESPYILLSCGYDKNIRKWDIRTGACEQSWEDPFYATVYCLDTDNYCTVLTGTESHGRVVLWDMRVKKYIQMYFMDSCRKARFSSPVYALSFDVHQLFTATDRHLNILDFSSKTKKIRNYSNM